MDDGSSAQPYVVAVSGGVDSVVLLDMLVRESRRQLIVAHVDHGIREDSREDARLAQQLAARHGLVFECATLTLGSGASEDEARRARYAFLRDVAKKHDARIVTAHHADDVVETVAINLIRGTGWRGVAVFGARDIDRPLVTMFKDEIIAYARRHSLTWREDSTNSSSKYLRNRLRTRCRQLSVDQKCQVLALWAAQRELAQQIDNEVSRLATNLRHTYIMCDEKTGVEMLRGYLRTHRVSLTTPQLVRALYAVKAAQAGTRYSLGRNVFVYFSTTTFSLERDK